MIGECIISTLYQSLLKCHTPFLEYSVPTHTHKRAYTHAHIPSAPSPTPHPSGPIFSLFKEISLTRLSILDASSLSHYSLFLKPICVLPQYPYTYPK